MDQLAPRLAHILSRSPQDVTPPDELHLQGLSLRALPYDRLKSLPVALSGLWLANNQLSHCPNLLQELLESFPSLTTVDLEGNSLTCDHLRLLPSAEERERRRQEEERLLRALQGGGSRRPKNRDDTSARGEEEEEECVSDHTLTPDHHDNLRPYGVSRCGRGHCHSTPYRASQLSCFFCSMRVCYLDINNLTTLPPELFTCLPNLRWLTAQRNSLTSIPPEVGMATNLEGLRLDFNQLRELPKEIGLLHNLLCLSICNNNLQSLPEELAGLQRLETLMVQGNPELLSLPSCVQGRLTHLTEFNVDPLDQRPEHQRLPLGTIYRVDNLLNITAGRVLKIFETPVEQHNIPEELKELLLFEGRRCSQCTGVYFGDGVAERVWEARLCSHAVLLRGRYCSLDCFRAHLTTSRCFHTH